MQTPFYDQIIKLAGRESARFHMPGHKGNVEKENIFADIMKYDITEIEGADDLSCPQGPLLQSELNMSRAYGSGRTLYSAAGSTSCVKAMITMFVNPGEKLVIQRGCHASAVRAMALLGVEPEWMLPENGYISLQQVQNILVKSGAKAVYLTSPDYYGRIQDIAGIAEVCKSHDAALLVDNAHGAHLKFGKKDLHPISLGADAAADSAHKTLACLTPAAMLHLKDENLAYTGRQALNLYSSTSPSYPVMMTLDLAAGMLLECPPDFEGLSATLKKAAENSMHLVEPCDDPLKLCVFPAKGGWEAQDVYTAMCKAGIVPEMYDGSRIVLMASPWNSSEDFIKLKKLLESFPEKEAVCPETRGLEKIPESVMGVRQAFFAQKQHINAKDSAGRIMAGISAPCPPGVPLVIPGEIITNRAAGMMVSGGILEVDVVK